MLFAKRSHLVFGATILLAMLLVANTTTGQTTPQGVGNRTNQVATATVVPTPEAVDPTSDFPAMADQIAKGPHTTVKSDDGRLVMLIPEGALPSDVPAARIKITSIRPNRVPVTIAGSQPTLAYRFEPDGLQFSTPAVIILTMNPSADGILPMLFSVSGEKVEAITSILYTTDPKSRRLIVTAPIAHFSELISSKGLFGVFVNTISDHVQNNAFSAEASVFREDPSPIQTWTLKGNWSASSPVEPRDTRDTPPVTALSTSQFKVKQQFTCKGLNDFARISYTANVDFDLTYVVNEQTKTARLGQTLHFTRNFMCIRMVQDLVVTFGNFTTTYKISASNSDVEKLTYAWSNSNPCGEFHVTEKPSEAKWVHPHTAAPGSCPEEGTEHPGEITVVVSDGRGATETVTYTAGSAVGFCKFSLTDSQVKGPCTITP